MVLRLDYLERRMAILEQRYKHSCSHDPETWETQQIRGHDARTGFVHFYEQVLCAICEAARVEARGRKTQKRQNLK